MRKRFTAGLFITASCKIQISGGKLDLNSDTCDVVFVLSEPGKVSNLRVSDNTKNSLRLHWVPPKGGYTGFRVKAMSGNKVYVLALFTF